MKQAWVLGLDEVGPSKDTLFLGSELGEEAEDRAAVAESKAPLVLRVEL